VCTEERDEVMKRRASPVLSNVLLRFIFECYMRVYAFVFAWRVQKNQG
jgi:hypothetical protein